ncbi:MAG: response regulator [Rhodospirillales bacterium]|nr:response regulator [Rhodospirillales bacterium]MCB9996100.1 response regulator [Rhodospirillales bacterium]
MKLIQESPEHHFLTLLDKVKRDPAGWLGFRFALSQKLQHEDLISNLDHIKGKLHKLRQDSDALVKIVADKLKDNQGAMLYQFSDGDVLLLVRASDDAERKAMQAIYGEVEEKIGKKLCTQTNLAKDIYSFQKLADARFLSASRIKSYEAMADGPRVQSIGLRRERREDAVILIVEDDRFTASYAANILNKDYDIVIAKTGEEAITYYIEHAPDMVFLDIHLPGLDGLDTLQALRKADGNAFIFMLSVDTVKQNIVGATKFGAAGFLKKPFGKERLLAAVSKSPYVKELKQKSTS